MSTWTEGDTLPPGRIVWSQEVRTLIVVFSENDVRAKSAVDDDAGLLRRKMVLRSPRIGAGAKFREIATFDAFPKIRADATVAEVLAHVAPHLRTTMHPTDLRTLKVPEAIVSRLGLLGTWIDLLATGTPRGTLLMTGTGRMWLVTKEATGPLLPETREVRADGGLCSAKEWWMNGLSTRIIGLNVRTDETYIHNALKDAILLPPSALPGDVAKLLHPEPTPDAADDDDDDEEDDDAVNNGETSVWWSQRDKKFFIWVGAATGRPAYVVDMAVTTPPVFTPADTDWFSPDLIQITYAYTPIDFSLPPREAFARMSATPVASQARMRQAKMPDEMRAAFIRAGTIYEAVHLPPGVLGLANGAAYLTLADGTALRFEKYLTEAPAKPEEMFLVLKDNALKIVAQSETSDATRVISQVPAGMGVSDAVRALTMPDRKEAARRLNVANTAAPPLALALHMTLDQLSGAPDGTLCVFGDALIACDHGKWFRVERVREALAVEFGPVKVEPNALVRLVRYGSSYGEPWSRKTIAKIGKETGVDVYLTRGSLFIMNGSIVVLIGHTEDGQPRFWFDQGNATPPREASSGWKRIERDPLKPVFTPERPVDFALRSSPFREVVRSVGTGPILAALEPHKNLLDPGSWEILTAHIAEYAAKAEPVVAPTPVTLPRPTSGDLLMSSGPHWIRINGSTVLTSHYRFTTIEKAPERPEEKMNSYPIGTIMLVPGITGPVVVVNSDGRTSTIVRGSADDICTRHRDDVLPSAGEFVLFRPRTGAFAELYGTRPLAHVLQCMSGAEARHLYDLAGTFNGGAVAAAVKVLCEVILHVWSAGVEFADIVNPASTPTPAPIAIEPTAGEAVVAALSLGAQMAAAKTASDVIHAGAMRLAGPVAGVPLVRLATPIALRFALERVPADALPVDKRHVEKGVDLAIAAQAYETVRDVVAALLPMLTSLADLARRHDGPIVEVYDGFDPDADTDHGLDIPDLPVAAVEVIDVVPRD